MPNNPIPYSTFPPRGGRGAQPRVAGSISGDPLVANPPGDALIPIVDVTNKTTTVDEVRGSTAKTIQQGAHGFTPGMALFNSGGTWTKSRANAIATARVDGVVASHNLTAGAFVVVSGGAIAGSWVPNTQYYLSDSTAGVLTTTPPTALTSFIVPVLRTGLAGTATVNIGEPLSLAKIPDSALENPGGVGPGGSISPGLVAMFPRSGMPASLPGGWMECDGANGTTNEADVGAMAVIIKHGGTVATPVFDIPAGSYTGAQTITITCATSGVEIRVTTDGSTPSRVVGAIYGAPFIVAAGTTTVKAIAFRIPTDPTLTMVDSAIETAVYTVTAGDTTPPTLINVVIPAAGTTLLLGFPEGVVIGGGGSGGVTLAMSGGAVTATFAGVAGGEAAYTLSRTVLSGETGTVSYAQPGNGIEDLAGNDLPSFSGHAISNLSTATGGGAGTPGWIYSHPGLPLSVDGSFDESSTQWQKIAATYTGNVDKVSLCQHYVNSAGKVLKMCLISGDGATVLGSGSWTSDGYHENEDIEITLGAPVAVVNGQNYWVGWSYPDTYYGQVRLGYDGNGTESGISYSFPFSGFPQVPVNVVGTSRYRVGLHQV